MSTILFRNGGIEPPETTSLSTTSATTVLTGLTYSKTVETIALANVDPANACIVKLEWVDSTPTGHTFWNKEVAAKDTVIIDTIPLLVSDRGKVRSIRATATVSGVISVTVVTSAQSKESPLVA